MSKTGRREFLKQAGAGFAGAAVLGYSPLEALGQEKSSAASRPIPPHRPLVVPGVHGYPDRQSAAAGETIAFKVSSTERYRFSICRLGLEVDDPKGDAVLYAFLEAPARPQAIHPGSYVHVEKGLDAEKPLAALTLEAWIRPWQFGRERGLIAQYSYPQACGIGIFLTSQGGIAFYLGDGAGFKKERLNETPPGRILRRRWHHVAAVWDGSEKAIWIDGQEAGHWPHAGPVKPATAPLRLAAYGEEGLADHFFDGDLAMPAIYNRALSSEEMQSHFQEKGLKPATGESVLACWSLSEERGDAVADVSGNERHGRVINHATWMVGGPGFNPSVPRFGNYDPRTDPQRGHALRFASDDLYDCRWETTQEWTAPRDVRPGICVGRIEYEMGGKPYTYQITFIIKKAPEKPRAPILLLAAANTWRAYSSTPFARPQPGWRHLCGTEGMPNSPGDPPAYSFYRGHAAGQGTYQVGLRMPWPAAGPTIRYGDRTDYSHLMRAERFAQAWIEKSGYEYDVITDLDLHRDPGVLQGYKVFFVNGHSEYWSIPMYEGLRRYLESGGNLVCLSGNSLFWRVSFNDDGTILECRKVDAPGNQLLPKERGECWHSQDGRRGGLLNDCGYPSWDLIGLTTLGWNDHGNPDHFSPFLVEEPEHFLFKRPVDLGMKKGDPLGQAPGGGLPRANGHEVDVRVSTLRRILKDPIPDGATHPDDPPGIQLLGASKGWPKSAPKFDAFLRPVSPDIPLGGELIYWERPSGGRVLNAGSIGAGWALLADEKFQGLLANTLHHFGVPRPV
ncbi:MAG: LamG domain-containing protein [Planctomycetes bacterium]|nr:LamG domain-containing protein [Planctomycetota bacterium]